LVIRTGPAGFKSGLDCCWVSSVGLVLFFGAFWDNDGSSSIGDVQPMIADCPAASTRLAGW
jgi:hypothetical protein